MPFLDRGDRILDAGAGGGEVVFVLRRKGFEATGLEPDEHYAQYAREQLHVPVDTGFVQDVAFPENSFDVITMYHALEHVEDPTRILETLRTWLAEDGRLLVEVPNVEARCLAPAHRFHFAHFYNFNRATLEALGRKTGFAVLKTELSPDGGNLVTVFRRVPEQQAVDHLEGNYARVASVVRGHTLAAFYCSPAPYAGATGRLRAYLADRWAARGATAPVEVLESLLKRSEHA
jgi:SAM-dependent methyltransferase